MPRRVYHNYWVYIITNKPKGTLYIGVTGGIDDRMEKHTSEIGSLFASKYKLKRLVYFEEFQYSYKKSIVPKSLLDSNYYNFFGKNCENCTSNTKIFGPFRNVAECRLERPFRFP